MTVAILIGVAIAAAVLMIITGLTPTNPALDRAIERLSPDSDYEPVAGGHPRGIKGRLGSYAEHNLAGRRGFATPIQDLTLIGKDSRWYWTQRITSGLAGLTIPLVLALLNTLMGNPIPPVVLVVGALAGGIYFFFVQVDVDLRSRAKTARDSFARAVGNYQQQMVIHRRAGKGAATAMRDAAEVSDAEVFLRIREEIARATLAGGRLDDALDRLGDRTGVPELREVGATMRLADQRGVRVGESLLARARAGRDKVLGEEYKRATNRTTLMNGPVIGIVALLMLACALPAVAALLAA